MEIQDKVIVVTGAGGAFAREIVLGLLAEGARVAAVDHREQNLADTASRADAGGRLSTHVAPLSDRAAIEALPEAVLAAHGAIDALAHVGGSIHATQPLSQLPVEEIEQVISNNLLGAVYINKAFLPHLLERPEASLVNFSHAGALSAIPGQGGYTTSKGGVRAWTETLAAELADTSVVVTVAFPGDIGPAPATSAEDAARQTIDAIKRGPRRVLIGQDAVELDRLSRADD
ncbi:SDR family NAD(P)-dependent oxidoreductase [Glaciibacter sp. 2TAF33]|uniref:SDR family NAD(P)-dependent oxidoreductase n=1 Tax=Glaciibacter sp. 2TAF33 TaxID=3233015 RepID=UPI003F8EAC8F